MGFGEAIKSFFSNYVNFKGRARRSEYWFVTLFLVLINIATTIVDALLFGAAIDLLGPGGGLGLFGIVWSLAVLLPSLALVVRRLHDTDRSAWWMLMILIPIIGWIVLFVFTVLDSTPGENRHGISPKYGSRESKNSGLGAANSRPDVGKSSLGPILDRDD